MYKNILVALDVFEEIDDLLSKVIEYIDAGAEVQLCTAVLPLENMYSYSPVDGYALVVSGFQQELLDNCKERMQSLLEKLGLPLDHGHVTVGKTGKAVQALAEELNSDLIIVGCSGKGTMRAMLGSNSRDIVSGAPCDALVINYN